MGTKASKLSCSRKRKLGKDEPLEDIIDYDELENLFSTTNKPKAERGSGKKTQSAILESKKAYNLAILLGHLKMPLEEIYQAVLAVDETKLSEPQIRTMLTCAPERLEMQALKSYKDDPEKLGAADKFALKMSSISDYEQRLRAMLFKAKFHERIEEVSPEIEFVINASLEVKSSKKLAKILEVVLATGNYMNRGQNRIAGASGFRISFLTKLLSTKTTDNKSTLLHVITNTILNKSPELVDVKEELEHIPQAAKVSSQMVGLEMEELKIGMKQIRDGVKSSNGGKDNENDKYKDVMGKFMSEAENKFKNVVARHDKMKTDFKSACEFFGEDSAKITTEDFFGPFAIFLQHFETAKADLTKGKAKKEEMVKKEKEEPIRQRKHSRGLSFNGVPPVINQDELKKSFEAVVLRRKKSVTTNESTTPKTYAVPTSDSVITHRRESADDSSTATEVASKIIQKGDSTDGKDDHADSPKPAIKKDRKTQSLVVTTANVSSRDHGEKQPNYSRHTVPRDTKKRPPPPPRRTSSLTKYDLDTQEAVEPKANSESPPRVKQDDVKASLPVKLKTSIVKPPPVKPKPVKPKKNQALDQSKENDSSWIVTLEKREGANLCNQEDSHARPAEKSDRMEDEANSGSIAPCSSHVSNPSSRQDIDMKGSQSQEKGASLYKTIMEKYRSGKVSNEDLSESGNTEPASLSLYASLIKPKLSSKHTSSHSNSFDKSNSDTGRGVLDTEPGSGTAEEASLAGMDSDAFVNEGVLSSHIIGHQESLSNKQYRTVGESVRQLSKNVDTLGKTNGFVSKIDGIPDISSRCNGERSVSGHLSELDKPCSNAEECDQRDESVGLGRTSGVFIQSEDILYNMVAPNVEEPTPHSNYKVLEFDGNGGVRKNSPFVNVPPATDDDRDRSSSEASSASAEVSSFMLSTKSRRRSQSGCETPPAKPVSILKKRSSPSTRSENHSVKFSPTVEDDTSESVSGEVEHAVDSNFIQEPDIPPPPSCPPPLPPQFHELPPPTTDVGYATQFVPELNGKTDIEIAASDEGEAIPTNCDFMAKTDTMGSSPYIVDGDHPIEVPSRKLSSDATASTPQSSCTNSLLPSVGADLPPPLEFSNKFTPAPPVARRRKTSKGTRSSPPKELPPPPPPPAINFSQETTEAFEFLEDYSISPLPPVVPPFEDEAGYTVCPPLFDNGVILNNSNGSKKTGSNTRKISFDDDDKGPPSFVPPPPPVDRAKKPRAGSLNKGTPYPPPLTPPPSVPPPPPPTTTSASSPGAAEGVLSVSVVSVVNPGELPGDQFVDWHGISRTHAGSIASSASLPPPPPELAMMDFEFEDDDDFDIGPPPSIAPPPPPIPFSAYMTST